MASFEKAHEKFIATQGMTSVHISDDEKSPNLLCSNCFRDEGLRLDSHTIGINDKSICPSCNSEDGMKLTKELVRELCYRFFVRGTIEKCEYGGFPLIQFNEQNYNSSKIDVSSWLVEDVKLIERAGEIGLFYYGPRFWMFGEIEPLKSLNRDVERDEIIEKILHVYPIRELSSKDYFYRVRINPEVPDASSEYDTAPDVYLGKNRFDDVGFPALYGSPDLELCLHECRVTVEDNIYVGKLIPKETLKLLDLSVLLDEEETEFESLDMAIHFLFLAGKHSYPICRQIAKKIKEKGYDGIIYPSYFSYVRTGAIPFDTVLGMSIRRIPDLKDYAQAQSVPNILLFGRPVRDGKVVVDCINKVLINRVGYDITFGPAYHKAFGEESYKDEVTKKFTDDITELLKKR